MDTLEDTVDVEITPDTIASQVEMERDGHEGSILIVEGDSDSLFFGSIFDEINCKIVVSNGKENAIGAIEKLNEENNEGVLCILDADFHHLGISTITPRDNLIVLECHDLEIFLIESKAFDKIIAEYGDKNRIDREVNSRKISVRDMMYSASEFMGAFRLWSIETGNNLKFKHINKSEYKFIESKNLVCDKRSLISSVKNASKKFSLNENVVEREVDKIIRRGYDRRQMSNGHDMCAVIAKSLRGFLSQESSAVACKSNIERMLRIGFEKNEFKSTELYKKIKEWQDLSGRYIVVSF